MFEISGVRYSFSKVQAFKILYFDLRILKFRIFRYQVVCYFRIFRCRKTGFRFNFQVPAFSPAAERSEADGFSRNAEIAKIIKKNQCVLCI